MFCSFFLYGIIDWIFNNILVRNWGQIHWRSRTLNLGEGAVNFLPKFPVVLSDNLPE